MGSDDGMKELIEKLAAKIDDLKTSLDKLAPLAPVAEQLATLPSKVVALQSSAFENQEQVRALNLAILRVENAQREGRPHAEDNGNTTGEGSINRARQGPVPPLENDRQPPRGPGEHRGAQGRRPGGRWPGGATAQGEAAQLRRSGGRRRKRYLFSDGRRRKAREQLRQPVGGGARHESSSGSRWAAAQGKTESRKGLGTGGGARED
ncbi:hypothetical protein GUJ93_ZPchr0005g15440 [Zizania palustris]|uniref:Uncharacterized protein n=1 Tax=Zizania palustris TaxID=103762 RepID=A0A8J5SAZ1_ZIZPA|nr:hypothetical protein GUJ93_ZPchr0005g15440 [Zizania palustris]